MGRAGEGGGEGGRNHLKKSVFILYFLHKKRHFSKQKLSQIIHSFVPTRFKPSFGAICTFKWSSCSTGRFHVLPFGTIHTFYVKTLFRALFVYLYCGDFAELVVLARYPERLLVAAFRL